MIKIHSNTEILEQAVSLLEELTDQIVFVGGCSTGMLITDPAAPAVRATLDVDVITNVDKLTIIISCRKSFGTRVLEKMLVLM
jgi:hypothetical protein